METGRKGEREMERDGDWKEREREMEGRNEGGEMDE